MRERPDLAITDTSDRAVAHLAARTDAIAARAQAALGWTLPQRPQIAVHGPVTVVWTRPGQWLALRQGRDDAFADAVAAALADTASVTDLTGARTIVRVAGGGARAVLSQLVPLDLHPAAFPARAAASTVAAHLPIQLWRLEGETYEVACYRSYAGALRHALADAAATA